MRYSLFNVGCFVVVLFIVLPIIGNVVEGFFTFIHQLKGHNNAFRLKK